MRRLIWAAALVATPAMAADKASFEQGRAVFTKWCAPCHARSPRAPGTMALEAKYLGKLPPALEDRSDLSPAMVATFVRQGVSLMAPFRKTEVSDRDLAALGAYLAAPVAARKGGVK